MAQRTVAYMMDYLKADPKVPHSVTFDFRWEEFKKTPYKPFTVSLHIELWFKPFVYDLKWLAGKDSSRSFLYSTDMPEEEVHKISADMATMLYDLIQLNRAQAAQP